MMFTPNFFTGKKISLSPTADTSGLTSSSPNILGTDGPNMSASNNAVLRPFLARVTARLTATVDFPTPPLPDATTIMFLIPSMGIFSKDHSLVLIEDLLPYFFQFITDIKLRIIFRNAFDCIIASVMRLSKEVFR